MRRSVPARIPCSADSAVTTISFTDSHAAPNQ